MNFYVPDGLVLGTAVNGTNATDAPNNPDVQARVSAFFNDIRNLYGISRGTVTYVPLPAKYRFIEEQDLEDAWKQTKATPTGRGAHIILSEAVADWWGIASGIPGAANSPGTDQSGLILSSIPQGTPEEEAFVMAHELGHFMGLNHTTEISGQDADPLEDTPQCDHVFDETCPDFNNIMAPTGALVSPILTSALQRRVVTGSPILRALLVGDPPVAGKAFSLPPNWKRIFGHPSTALSAAERAIASSFCGRPFKLSSKTGGTRAEWTRLATNPALPRFVRMRAQKALAR